MRRALKVVLGFFVAVVVLVALGLRCDRPAAEVEARRATPPSRFVDVDGLRAHYRDRGQGPAIVLLHGSNASLFTWEGWSAALATDHRVVSVDLPGHGLTGPDPRGRYSPLEMAAFVDRFVTAIGLTRFALAGNSMGGGVAWRYALLHPDKVDKLILVDAAGYPMKARAMLTLFTLPGLGHVARWVTPRFALAQSLHQVYGDPGRVDDALIDLYQDLLLRDGNREATRERIWNQAHAGDDGLLSRLSEIQMPTLILWGTRDLWISPANGPRFAAAIIGSRLVLLDGLGHVPMEEDPARSVAPVRDFLAH